MANFTKYIFLEFEKIFKFFLSTSEGLLLNISETWSPLFWITASFIFLTSLVWRQNVQKQHFAAVFQIGVLKHFAIFTCASVLEPQFNKIAAFTVATLLKRDFNTCVFLWILQSILEKLFIENTSVGCFWMYWKKFVYLRASYS